MKQCGVTIIVYRYSLQKQGEKQEIDNNPENKQNACLFFEYLFLNLPHTFLMIPIITAAKVPFSLPGGPKTPPWVLWSGFSWNAQIQCECWCHYIFWRCLSFLASISCTTQLFCNDSW